MLLLKLLPTFREQVRALPMPAQATNERPRQTGISSSKLWRDGSYTRRTDPNNAHCEARLRYVWLARLLYTLLVELRTDAIGVLDSAKLCHRQ